MLYIPIQLYSHIVSYISEDNIQVEFNAYKNENKFYIFQIVLKIYILTWFGVVLKFLQFQRTLIAIINIVAIIRKNNSAPDPKLRHHLSSPNPRRFQVCSSSPSKYLSCLNCRK